MASGPHRPGFYVGVLIAGFLAGGFLTSFLARVAAGQRRQAISSPQPSRPASGLSRWICWW